jgi:hypothetical protein
MQFCANNYGISAHYGKNIVAEGEEILIKDTDDKIIAKFEEGKFVLNGAGSLVKDVVTKRILKTVSKYDSKLGQMVEYPMYNNVALGKSSGGSLKQFGDAVGANVWTKETDNVFTSMYNLPERNYVGGFERSIREVLDVTTGTNQGKILFDITGVDIPIWHSFVHYSGARLRRVPTYGNKQNKAFATRVVKANKLF